jgi:hypothetical protein
MKNTDSTAFHINYHGMILKVIPVMEGDQVHYFIYFFLREVEIFLHRDRQSNQYWYEKGKGKSLLAYDLGKLIETHLA